MGDDKRDEPEIEITPEMIEAGARAFYTQPAEPDEDEVKAAVAAIFSSMLKARPK